MTALYNSEQINELSAFFLTRDLWQDFTPVITQSGNVTYTLTYARYVVLAQTVILQVRLAITGTGTGNNAIVISGLPTAIQPAHAGSATHLIGTGIIQDVGTAFYSGPLVAVGADDLRIIPAGHNNYAGIDPNFALASGDAIGLKAAYER